MEAQPLKLIYLSPQSEREQQVRQILESSGKLEQRVQDLNALFHLPDTVIVRIGGEPGPLHDPARGLINIPYGFVSGIRDTSPEEDNILDVTLFALYHEIGHALIDLLEMPLPGEVEKAADALATLLSIELVSDGGRPAFAAAQLMMNQEPSGSAHPWFDQANDSRRSQRLICWILGSDPGRLGWVAEDAGIESQAADRCPTEYEEMRSYWVELLVPHLNRR